MTYDITIIGAGPGGYVAAICAARLGAKVALIERDSLGGVCLNRGCIPTKAIIACAHALHAVKSAGEFGVTGIEGNPSIDMKAVQARKEMIVAKLRSGIESLIESAGVDLIRGNGMFRGKKILEVDGHRVDAKNFVIATGSSWMELPNLKADGKLIVTSDSALDWTEVPKRLLILGGGVIGCEFACAMNLFGSHVTIIEAMPSILPPVEQAVSRLLARSMKARGIEMMTSTTIERVETRGDSVTAHLSGGKTIEADRLLISIGRRPCSAGLGLESAGVDVDARGAIKIDARMKSSADGIFAIGDVTGGQMLAHVASAEGIYAVESILGHAEGDFDRRAVPSPIFTSPEIASVGLTSEELKKRGIEFKTGRFPYAASGKALCDGDAEGQAIVHADAKNGGVLGVHIYGGGATTMIAEAALAIEMGATASDMEKTIHSHPTLSEALAEAAADVYGRAVHKIGHR